MHSEEDMLKFVPMSEEKINVEVDKLLAQLTIKEKVSLLSGEDNWGTMPIERLGVKKAMFTDGPHGVRNPWESGRGGEKSTFFPVGVAMASTWNPDLIYKVGEAIGEETRAADCDLILGPCVNIIRHPLAGRNFESYSEDPYLAAKIGAGYIKGCQSIGVGTSLKHFAMNNQEVERMRGNSIADERTMREIYLTAFEMIVKDADPWTVMCSYNRVNGEYASANKHLLTDILRDEWGYKGLVMSDWYATHETEGTVKAGLDLEMPGPSMYHHLLEHSVEHWSVHEKVIDRAAANVLRLLFKLGVMGEGSTIDGCWNTKEHQQVAFDVAAECVTLLKNEDVLPLDKKQVRKISVIGRHAAQLASGGGSSRVEPPYYATIIDSLKNLYGDEIEFTYHEGVFDTDTAPYFGAEMGAKIPDGINGIIGEYWSNSQFKGEPKVTRIDSDLEFFWWHGMCDADLGNKEDWAVRWTTEFDIDKDEQYMLKYENSGVVRFYIDGKLVAENARNLKSMGDYDTVVEYIDISAGHHEMVVEYVYDSRDLDAIIRVILQPNNDEYNDNQIKQAAELAAASDAVIICAGFPLHYESEGADRTSMRLCGRMDDMIETVASANKNNVVVIHAGVAVEMPWIDKTSAVLDVFYPGQEAGNVIAKILFGEINPSGKLTQSFPFKLEDTPAYLNYPGIKDVVYGEGIFVGYRYYDKKKMEVLFPFGHGLSYTEFEYSNMKVEFIPVEKYPVVSVDVKNVGKYRGKEVVQLYVGDVVASVLRPVRELKGFEKIELDVGESKTVRFTTDARSFAFYDVDFVEGWVVEPGEFEIAIGSSSRDIRVVENISLG